MEECFTTSTKNKEPKKPWIRPDQWIGVDLDGTLAYDDKAVHFLDSIGDPIPAMLNRVKKWIADGIEVRIITARVHEEDYYSLENYECSQKAKAMVEEWCIKHIGKLLPVSCKKDGLMKELWDDRAVQVEKNTGRRIGRHYRE